MLLVLGLFFRVGTKLWSALLLVVVWFRASRVPSFVVWRFCRGGVAETLLGFGVLLILSLRV